MHTPGPWFSINLPGGRVQVVTATGDPICTMHDENKDVLANAQLIVQSHNMLAVLRRAHDLDAEITAILDAIDGGAQ